MVSWLVLKRKYSHTVFKNNCNQYFLDPDGNSLVDKLRKKKDFGYLEHFLGIACSKNNCQNSRRYAKLCMKKQLSLENLLAELVVAHWSPLALASPNIPGCPEMLKIITFSQLWNALLGSGTKRPMSCGTRVKLVIIFFQFFRNMFWSKHVKFKFKYLKNYVTECFEILHVGSFGGMIIHANFHEPDGQSTTDMPKKPWFGLCCFVGILC